MKPPPFDYVAASSIEEALSALTEHGDDARVLAGGQSLLPLLALRLARPEVVVDIGRIADLDRVSVEDGEVRVGALVRQSAGQRALAQEVPLVAEAIGLIGHRTIRNRGTIGGSLAHADPAAELPSAAVALDASFVLQSARGTRVVAARDFFVGYLMTAAAPDEVLVEARFPRCVPRTGYRFEELCRRDGDFAIVGVAAAVTLDDRGHVETARLALAAVDSTPRRCEAAEDVLRGSAASPEAWAAAAEAAAADLDPPDDLHGSGAYRRQLVRVLTRRALTVAAERAA